MSYKKTISLFLLIACAVVPARSMAFDWNNVFSVSTLAKISGGIVAGLGLG